MKYLDLHHFEHRTLPLIFLKWQEDIEFAVSEFPLLAKQQLGKFAETGFFVTKDTNIKQIMQKFITDFDCLYCFCFPFEENTQYIGLCKYAFLLCDKHKRNCRYFVYELSRDFDGTQWKPVYSLIQYTLADVSKDKTVFIRTFME